MGAELCQGEAGKRKAQRGWGARTGNEAITCRGDYSREKLDFSHQAYALLSNQTAPHEAKEGWEAAACLRLCCTA